VNRRDDQWLKLDDLARRLESDPLTVTRHVEREGMPAGPDGLLFNRAQVFRWMLGRGCDATYLRYALQPQLKKAWVVCYSPDGMAHAIPDVERLAWATDTFTLGGAVASAPAWCVVIDGRIGIESTVELLSDMGEDRPLVILFDPAYDFEFLSDRVEAWMPSASANAEQLRKAVRRLYRKAGGDVNHLIARSDE
jgi:hypothetical protein